MIGKDSLLLPETLIIIFLIAMLLIAAINMRSTRNLSDCKKISRYPRISVLVPARNEEDKCWPVCEVPACPELP